MSRGGNAWVFRPPVCCLSVFFESRSDIPVLFLNVYGALCVVVEGGCLYFGLSVIFLLFLPFRFSLFLIIITEKNNKLRNKTEYVPWFLENAQFYQKKRRILGGTQIFHKKNEKISDFLCVRFFLLIKKNRQLLGDKFCARG